jgi:ABC-type branched-subunit amino acid transport system permease subunit
VFYAWGFRNKAFNGADGMGGIPRLEPHRHRIDLKRSGTFALAVIVACTIAWLILELVWSSPFGRTLDAIRQNPSRVAALGGRVLSTTRGLHGLGRYRRARPARSRCSTSISSRPTA